MDVLGISSFASAISAQKGSEAKSEAQVSLIKKQSDQHEQVVSTIIQSAVPEQPGKGALLAVA